MEHSFAIEGGKGQIIHDVDVIRFGMSEGGGIGR